MAIKFAVMWQDKPKAAEILGHLMHEAVQELPPIKAGKGTWYQEALYFEAGNIYLGLKMSRFIRLWLLAKYQVTGTELRIDGYGLEEYIIRQEGVRLNILEQWKETLDVLKKTRQLFPSKELQQKRLALEKLLTHLQG